MGQFIGLCFVLEDVDRELPERFLDDRRPAPAGRGPGPSSGAVSLR